MTTSLPGSAIDLVRRERRAMIFWTSIIIGLLLTGIGASVGAALVAVRGRPVIEADYYSKALHWDDHVALVQASAKLGWKTEVNVGSTVTDNGDRALMLTLQDNAGIPIDDARVSIGFFHRARPLDLRQAELKNIGNGLYAAAAPINRAGIWELRVTIRRAGPAGSENPDQMFVQSLTKDLPE